MSDVEEALELNQEQRARAERLHADTTVVNASDPTLIEHGDESYVQKLRQSGVKVVNHTPLDQGTLLENLQSLHDWWQVYAQFPEDVLVAKEFADIDRAREAGKIAVFLGFQDTSPLEGHLFLLDIFHALGVRFIQLTYQRRNFVGDGGGERTDAGLSKFGVEVVNRMNDLGMVIDLSHVGRRSTLDAIEISEHPVTVTHAAVRKLCDIPRNKTDEEIQALAAKGGVIGIIAKSGFLRPNGAQEGTTIDDYIDHIDYVRDLVGIDYVGIGTSISDERRYTKERMARLRARLPEIPMVTSALRLELIHPKDLDSPSRLFGITAGLLKRGYRNDEITKILGANFLRVFQSVMQH